MTAPSLNVADVVEIMPSVFSDDYVDKLLDVCIKHQVDAVISLNDLELPILSKRKSEFTDIGVSVIVSDYDIIDICFDKYKTSQYIESIGLLYPKTYLTIDQVLVAVNNGDIKYPLVVKPRWGSGSIGVEFVYNEEELCLSYALLKSKIQRTMLSKVSNCDDNIIIQQKINGKEYGLDIINDFNGNFQSVVIKKKIAMRSGETDKAVTVKDQHIFKVGQRIANSTKHIANIDCDIIEQDGCYYVLELNPRFGGGYPFSHEAGVNLPKAIVDWLHGNETDACNFNYVEGAAFSKCDFMVEINTKA